MRTDTRTDDELLASGTQDAIAELFHRHKTYMTNIASNRLYHTHADPDDIVQESFIAALNSLSQYRIPGTFRGWLGGIVIHKLKTAASHTRTERERTSRLSELETEGKNGDPMPFDPPDMRTVLPPLEDELHHDYIPLLPDAVAQLPPKLREAIQLVYLKELTPAQAGDKIGVCASGVSWRIRQALKQLRLALNVTECKYQPNQKQLWAWSRQRKRYAWDRYDDYKQKEREGKRRKAAYGAVARLDAALGRLSGEKDTPDASAPGKAHA